MICELCNRLYVGTDVDMFSTVCTNCKNIIKNVKETEMEKVKEEKDYWDRLEEIYEAALEANDLKLAYEVATKLHDMGL